MRMRLVATLVVAVLAGAACGGDSTVGEGSGSARPSPTSISTALSPVPTGLLVTLPETPLSSPPNPPTTGAAATVTVEFIDQEGRSIGQPAVSDTPAAMAANGHPPAATVEIPGNAHTATLTIHARDGTALGDPTTLDAVALVPNDPDG